MSSFSIFWYTSSFGLTRKLRNLRKPRKHEQEQGMQAFLQLLISLDHPTSTFPSHSMDPQDNHN